MLVQELYRIQNRLGWLPDAELRALAQRCRVPLYRLEEITSFFPHFRRQPPPAVEVKVCRDMSCHLRGSTQVISDLQKATGGNKEISVTGCSCLGRCDRAVAMLVEVNRAAGDHHTGNGHHAGGGEANGKPPSEHHALVYCNQTPQSAAK